MNRSTRKLHDRGQSLWLDNTSRDMLTSGTLAKYISTLSVAGVTANQTLFERTPGNGESYGSVINTLAALGLTTEGIFFALALEDLMQAADLWLPIFESTCGMDGWVSLAVSPLLADDTARTVQTASTLFARAGRQNLFIKIPGKPAGLIAVEQSLFNGVPVNVTLLFSREQYMAAAEAYLRALERRHAAGLDLAVESVASLFVSRWDVAVRDEIAPEFRNRPAVAMAIRAYKAYRDLFATERWQKLASAGARPQRLLWASTGTQDACVPDTLYIEALAARDTINTMLEKTLH